MKKITKITIAIFFLLSGVLFSPFAQATTHIPFQLTNTPYLDFDPKLNNAGYTVWAGQDGTDFEIYLYDGTDIHQITDNETSDMYPQINASGHVVWEGHDGIDTEIYLYNGIDIVQLTDNSSSDRDPQINDQGIVVWEGDDGDDMEIYISDGKTVMQLTNNSIDDDSPQINNNGFVVWQAENDYDAVEEEYEQEIFLYDGSTITQITDNLFDDKNPQINTDGFVVWRGYDGSDWEIFFYDGITTSQLTNNSFSDYDPQINDNNIIVWDGDSGGSDSEIFMATPCPDIDNDGYCAAEPDCEDNDPAINPGTSEVCGDGKDNDCNPETADVCPVVSVEISVSPSTSRAGEGIALTWRSSNATTVEIDQEFGAVRLSDTYYLNPLETTRYTITATGPSGTSTASAEVTVTGRLKPPENKLTAGDFAEYDVYGNSVDISNNFAIVGSPSADHIATNAGVAYIYKKEETGWVAGSKILASDGTDGDYFGLSVAIHDNYAIIGAMYADYTWESSGAAYIFQHNGVDWIEKLKISAITNTARYLGESVAISADYAVCGGSGQVFIYKRVDDNWLEMAILTDPITRNYSYFGHSISIYDDTIMIGSSDTAHIYRFNGLAWLEDARLPVPLPDYNINNVSIYGDYAVFGNKYEDDPIYSSLGAVYVYHYNGDEWLQQAKLTPAAPSSLIGFGTSVDINNDYLVVGAEGYGAESYWNNNGWGYVFKRSGSIWQEMGLFIASDGQRNDYFGTSISMSGATIMVGASNTRNNDSSSGAAYIYELPDVIVEFTANPKITPTGESILTWNSANADSCIIEPGIGSVAFSGSFPVIAYTTTAYTLTCMNSAETASANTTITVGHPPPAIIAEASTGIIPFGAPATLSWNTLHADSVTIDHGIGNMPAKGSTIVYPSEAINVYTIKAIGPGGETTTTATVMVLPTVSITAAPQNIQIGDSVTLTMSTQFADSCLIEPNIGEVPCNGSIVVTPSEISSINTYTITATGPAGVTTKDVDIAVTFPPPTIKLHVSQLYSYYWYITWQTTNTNSCIITPQPGSAPANSSYIFNVFRNMLYTVTAFGPGGTTTASIPIFIGPTPAQLIAIHSPQQGVVINRPDIMVKGSVYHAKNTETAVTVNGIIAQMDGEKFAANNVPLIEGENIITATATDILGNTATASMTVNVDLTDHHIKLVTDKKSGLTPLELNLKVDGTFNVVDPLLSYSGPGTAAVQPGTDVNEYFVSLTEPGLYFFTAEVTDAQSQFYSDTITIQVMDRTELDALLRAKWEGMKTALTGQDVGDASNYFTKQTQSLYNDIYTALYDNLPEIAQNMGDIQLIYLEENIAKYRIRKNELINSQQIETTYYIYFAIDEDGFWKIFRY